MSEPPLPTVATNRRLWFAIALFQDICFRALVTLPWLVASPPSDTAFYAVVAPIIPVLLIVFAVEFRRFEPLSQERFDRAYGWSMGFTRPIRHVQHVMLSKLPVTASGAVEAMTHPTSHRAQETCKTLGVLCARRDGCNPSSIPVMRANTATLAPGRVARCDRPPPGAHLSSQV